MIARPARYPKTSCRKVRSVPNANPGMLTRVAVLVSVATIEAITTPHGARRPVAK